MSRGIVYISGMSVVVPVSVKRLLVEVDVSTVNVSELCAAHGVSRTFFYELRKRHRVEGEAAFELGSRAPKHVANKTPAVIEDQIIRVRKELDDDGLDAGAETIHWHLVAAGVAGLPSVSTIWRILKRRGFVVDDPSKAPKKTSRSFEAGRANEMWQIDGTTIELADGTEVKAINIIDDGSRVWVRGLAAYAETADAALRAVCEGGDRWGFCERVLSDNGSAFKSIEGALAALGVAVSHSRPYHPQTCGKVERFHQTLKKWLSKQPAAETLEDLQTLLDQFAVIYNHERPHRANGRKTPVDQFNNMAKAGPADRPLNTPTRIYHGVVSANGMISAGMKIAISLGNAHANRPATTVITGLNTHVFINGQLVRTLTINPNKRVQALHPRRGRPTP